MIISRNWTDLENWEPTGPSARYDSAYAVNAPGTRAVVFGGRNLSGPFQDTWSFGGAAWNDLTPPLLTPTDSPSSRFGSVMAFDTSRDAFILFGGRDFTTIFNDTWMLNGSVWTRLATPIAPTPRAFAAFAPSPTLGGLVLFGGLGSTSNASDTWLLNRTGWSNITGVVIGSPAGRYGAAMSWDPAAGSIVMFGGFAKFVGYLGDTWTLTGHNWTQPALNSSPSARNDAKITYDPTQRSLLLFGGEALGPKRLGDLWQFNSSVGWTNVPSPGTLVPPVRSGAVWAELNTTAAGVPEFLLADGQMSGVSALSDTWLYGAGLPLEVTPPFPNAFALDRGQNLSWRALAFGGAGGYHYAWSGLPPGCNGIDLPSIACSTSAVNVTPSVITTSLSVTDSGGGQASVSGPGVLVNALPHIATMLISPSTVVLGSPIRLTVQVTGGTGAIHYSYAGVPAGCGAPTAKTFTCVPAAVGGFTIVVTVTDSTGASTAQSSILTVTSPAQGGAGFSPLLELALIGVAVLAGLLLLGLWLRHLDRRKRPPGPPSAVPSPPTN